MPAQAKSGKDTRFSCDENKIPAAVGAGLRARPRTAGLPNYFRLCKNGECARTRRAGACSRRETQSYTGTRFGCDKTKSQI